MTVKTDATKGGFNMLALTYYGNGPMLQLVSGKTYLSIIIH